jgi:maltose alpha-D-glucosyltransferase/alpha-amylase
VTTPVAEALPGLLPPFLPTQRWFGDKARQVAACEVEDLASLAGAERTVVVVVEVRFEDGGRQRYSLIVALRAAAGSLPVIGRLPDGAWIVEAGTDPDATLALLRGFASAGELPMARGGRLRHADASAEAREALAGPTPPVRSLGAEQSNTSSRVGTRFVFKLFRRLDVGENPEVEVGRFLTSETDFRAMPTLEGSLTYVTPAGESSTLGVLQQWVESAGDGWRYTLAGLGTIRGAGAQALPLADDIGRLGAITADFHAALASSRTAPAFAPEPITEQDVDGWMAEVRTQMAGALALVEQRRADWPASTRALATDALARVPPVWGRLRAPDIAETGAFARIRIHGDYHLGQTLKTPTGFALIDFEGEPAIPIARRRLKHGALKDVAGMLRSFDYAIETVCADRPESAGDLRARAGLREAFLDAYLEAATGHRSPAIPAGAIARGRWLAFFEFGKALYELDYEINNRPDWVHIPLRGLLRALDGLDA